MVAKERGAFLQQEFSQKILVRAQAKSVPFFIYLHDIIFFMSIKKQ